MNAKYSNTTGGIYPISAYKEFPEDSIDIPSHLYLKFQNGEISGFKVFDGYVVAASHSISSKESRIDLIQSIYESDMDKLNRAWLSSLISNGEGQSSRQASIKLQMNALNDALDADILYILMEQ